MNTQEIINELYVVRLRDNFVRKVIYVYRAFTSEEKLIAYLKKKITHRDKDEDILIVDVTCMKYFEETDSYDVMSIWEYNEERDAWLWYYSGYQSRLLFKLPVERSENGGLEKFRNEE
jgi:hypothetical protein